MPSRPLVGPVIRLGVVTSEPVLTITGHGADPRRRPRRRVLRGVLVSRPAAVVVAGPGTNRDTDAVLALDLAGAEPEVVLIGELVADPDLLDEARIVVVAGGFSYGDALGAGRMLGLDLTGAAGGRLGERLRSFVASGRPVIGICNGFQVLTRAGLLPGALGHNDHGRFDCRWVELAAEPDEPVHLDRRARRPRPLPHRPRRGALRPSRPRRPRRRRAGRPALRREQPERVRRRHRRRLRPDRCRARPDAPSGEPCDHPPTSTPPSRPDDGAHARAAPVRSGGAPCQVAHDDRVHRHRPAPARPARGQGAHLLRPRRRAPAVRHDRPPVGVRPHRRRRAVQGTGAQPARRVVVRAHRRRRGQPRRRRPRPEPARRPVGRDAAGRGGRARLHHGGHVDVAVAAVRCGRAHDLRLPLPRRPGEEHARCRNRWSRRRRSRRIGVIGARRTADLGRGRRARARRRPPLGGGVDDRPRAVPAWPGGRRVGRADPRRHEVRVRADARRRAAADRRGAHAGLVAVLGRRVVRGAAGRGRGAGEPRQGGRPPGARRRRLHGRRRRARAAGGRVDGDVGALHRRLRAAHRPAVRARCHADRGTHRRCS